MLNMTTPRPSLNTFNLNIIFAGPFPLDWFIYTQRWSLATIPEGLHSTFSDQGSSSFGRQPGGVDWWQMVMMPWWSMMLSCLGTGAWHIISRWLFVAGDGGRFYVCWSKSWKMKGGIWGGKEVSKKHFPAPIIFWYLFFWGVDLDFRGFSGAELSSQLRRIQITLQTSWSHEGFFILWPKEAAKFLRHVPMYHWHLHDIFFKAYWFSSDLSEDP